MIGHCGRWYSCSPIALLTLLITYLTLPEVAETEYCKGNLKVPQSLVSCWIRCIVKEVRRYAQEGEPEEKEHQELQKLEIHGDADTKLPQIRLPHTLATAVPASTSPK